MTLGLAFFSAFLLYAALGVLALVVTALLDKAIGKERALLLWAFVVVAITWAVKPAPPPAASPKPQTLAFDRAKFKDERLDPTVLAKPTGSSPLWRDPVDPGLRNAFQEQSDTTPLPPVTIAEPAPVAFPFPLPPTIPGVGPAARRLYRGAMPEVKTGDGSKIPDVPADAFSAYAPKPEDVFDWIVIGGSRQYVYIREIADVKEGDPKFENPASGLKWNLALKGTPSEGFPRDWKALKIDFAFIGTEAQAKAAMDNLGKAKRANLSTREPAPEETWFLKRTVDNQYFEALRAQGNVEVERLSTDSLKAVAGTMAEVGMTGKEDLGGWKRAVQVLSIALERSSRPPARPAPDVLLALIEAHRALHDEDASLSALAKYREVASSGAAAADGMTWLGDLFLEHLRLPYLSEAFYDKALDATPGSRSALLGLGDALSQMGRHDGAADAYKRAADARSAPDAAVRLAEALLREGMLPEAKSRADEALAGGSFDARGLLVRGAILYASGDLEGAKAAFAQAAALPGDGPEGATARRHRGEALYDLGLTEFRMGHGDASRAAFDAADVALRNGAERGRSPDEMVATEVGRALLQLAAGNVGEAADALERAKEQGPTVSYVEMLAGWIAASQGDTSRARQRFENALALAPDLQELDGWLADVRQRLAEASVAAGVPVGEAAVDFEAAQRFAERASERERRASGQESDFAAREALIKMRALHQSERKRFDAALKTAEATLARVREDLKALAIKGYCNYRLGAALSQPERWDQAIRDFQQILDLTTSKAQDPIRLYAAQCLEQVKKWLSLEQKLVTFDLTKLPQDWQTSESQNVRVVLDEGQVRFKDTGGTKSDGSPTAPTVFLRNDKLFDKGTLEEVEVRVRIPTKDAQGNNANNVTFGLLIQPTGGAGVARGVGLGVFYDHGKVAVRVAGGSDAQWKDAELHRVVVAGGDLAWDPDDKTGLGRPVRILVKRTNEKDGTMTVEVGPEGGELVKVLEDRISGFRFGRGPLDLWLGGWASQSQQWNVAVDDVRVVRRK